MAGFKHDEKTFMNDGDGRQFVDTNVLIYGHDVSAGEKHRQAATLIQKLWHDRQGCLSIQVLQEFYVNVTKKVARPLTTPDAIQIISDLSTWQVHSPSPADVLQAIRLQERYQINFWDAMIITSASRMGCKVLWSEDLSPGQTYDQVMVANPF